MFEASSAGGAEESVPGWLSHSGFTRCMVVLLRQEVCEHATGRPWAEAGDVSVRNEQHAACLSSSRGERWTTRRESSLAWRGTASLNQGKETLAI